MNEKLRAELAAAQDLIEVEVGGSLCRRIRYGDEIKFTGMRIRSHCYDCATEVGELHMPGCMNEVCPRCRLGQAFGCDCCAAPPGLSA